MQFRIRKNKDGSHSQTMQFLRSSYSKELKRSKIEIVASGKVFDLKFDGLSDEIREKLTETEISEFNEWKKSEDEKMEKMSLATSFLTLKIALEKANIAILSEMKEKLDEHTAQEIYQEFDELSKQMRKLGFSRPPRKKAVSE